MIIPASHIGLLALAHALEKMYWFFKKPDTKYISLGQAIGRLILAICYFYIYLFDPSDMQKTLLVRWSLFTFLGIDLFFIIQRHIMDRVFKHGN